MNPAQQIGLTVGGLILGTLAALVVWCQIEGRVYRHWDALMRWISRHGD